ncbi:MAG: hypothetical protein ACI4IS_00345 [Acutalibacteraceae bacterium]
MIKRKTVIDLAQSRCFLFAVGLLVRSAQEIKKAVRLSLRWICKYAEHIAVTVLIISAFIIGEMSCNGTIPYAVGLLTITAYGSAAVCIVNNIAKRGV